MRIVTVVVVLLCSICSNPASAAEAVWRLYTDTDYTDHFYTADCGDANNAQSVGYWLDATTPFFFIDTTQQPGTVPFFRFFNKSDHFYTVSADAEGTLGTYNPEGILGYIYPTPAPGLTALFRLYLKPNGHHFYTVSTIERGQAFNKGYIDEGIAGYVPVTGNISCAVGIFKTPPEYHKPPHNACRQEPCPNQPGLCTYCGD
jgi:hypothetical protein